jgi:hypothetical protein
MTIASFRQELLASGFAPPRSFQNGSRPTHTIRRESTCLVSDGQSEITWHGRSSDELFDQMQGMFELMQKAQRAMYARAGITEDML